METPNPKLEHIRVNEYGKNMKVFSTLEDNKLIGIHNGITLTNFANRELTEAERTEINLVINNK